MSSISNNLIPSVTSPSPFNQYSFALRRQFQGELIEIRSCIASLRHENERTQTVEDEMTQVIDKWQKEFTEALRLHVDADEIGKVYIELLQELLRDPLTTAPIDEGVLGTDGHTYGKMSLILYFASASDSYQHRSPLNPNSSSSFSTVPHPVVNHMLDWLKKHRAFLCSRELEQAFLQLPLEKRVLPTIPVREDSQERIRRIFQSSITLNEREIKLLDEENRKLIQEMDEKFAAWEGEVGQIDASLRQRSSENQRRLQEFSERNAEEALKIQGRMAEIEQKNEHAQKQASEQFDLNNRELSLRLEESRQTLISTREAERVTLESIQGQFTAQFQRILEPVAQAVETFTQKVSEKKAVIEARNQEALKKLEQDLQLLDEQIIQLTSSTEAVKKSSQQVSHQLDDVDRETEILQKGIGETQLAIRKMERKRKDQLWKTIAITGLACFAGTWALQHVLGSSTSGAFLPNRIALKIVF